MAAGIRFPFFKKLVDTPDLNVRAIGGLNEELFIGVGRPAQPTGSVLYRLVGAEAVPVALPQDHELAAIYDFAASGDALYALGIGEVLGGFENLNRIYVYDGNDWQIHSENDYPFSCLAWYGDELWAGDAAGSGRSDPLLAAYRRYHWQPASALYAHRVNRLLAGAQLLCEYQYGIAVHDQTGETITPVLGGQYDVVHFSACFYQGRVYQLALLSAQLAGATDDPWQGLFFWDQRAKRARLAAAWPVRQYGFYWFAAPWRGRLLFCGGIVQEKLGSYSGWSERTIYNYTVQPVMGCYSPPRLELARPLPYAIRGFTSVGGRLLAIAAYDVPSFSYEGRHYRAVCDWMRTWAGNSGFIGGAIGGPLYALPSELVLAETAIPIVDSLEFAWADDQAGGNRPRVDSLRFDWYSPWPVGPVRVDRLEYHWADDQAGGNRPRVDRLLFVWSTGLGLTTPRVDALEYLWDGGDWDKRPAVDSLEFCWADDQEGGNRPQVDLLEFVWQSRNVAVNWPKVNSLEFCWADDQEGGNRPKVDLIEFVWSDTQSGGNRPRVDSLLFQWSEGLPVPGRPRVDRLEFTWAADEAPPFRPHVRVDSLEYQWADEVKPPGEGESVLFITDQYDSNVVALRVTTDAGVDVDVQLRGIARADKEDLAVDDWDSYQAFNLGENVTLEEPGKELRVGIIKPDSVSDDTDIFVQAHCE